MLPRTFVGGGIHGNWELKNKVVTIRIRHLFGRHALNPILELEPEVVHRIVNSRTESLLLVYGTQQVQEEFLCILKYKTRENVFNILCEDHLPLPLTTATTDSFQPPHLLPHGRELRMPFTNQCLEHSWRNALRLLSIIKTKENNKQTKQIQKQQYKIQWCYNYKLNYCLVEVASLVECSLCGQQLLNYL